jgi:hypothetical protein
MSDRHGKLPDDTQVPGSERAAPRRDVFPDYDVLSKRDTPSWNQQTRAVIDDRLAIDPERHDFFDDREWRSLHALCDRIIPQSPDRPGRVPIAAMVDQKVAADLRDGYRHVNLPPIQDAWRRGLAALEAEAKAAYDRSFPELQASEQDTLNRRMQNGELHDPLWGDMPPRTFFQDRIVTDLIKAYYAHPTAWSEIGFGGPASPRGYVRLDFDRRDSWEAAEARPGTEEDARAKNRRVGHQ